MTNRQSPFAERWMYPLSVSCLICLLTAAVLIPTLPDRSAMVMSGMLRMRLSILLVPALGQKADAVGHLLDEQPGEVCQELLYVAFGRMCSK